MSIEVQWIGHASFLIADGTISVAIDPWKTPAGTGPVDFVLVSHSHFDHYSVEDVAAVSGPDTVMCGSADIPGAVALTPGETRDFDGFAVTGVPAYNVGKHFHPRENGWLGFVLELGGKRVYYAGDTDRIPEMRQLEAIDLALLPTGGTYTMDAAEAGRAAADIGCGLAVPYHWGDIVGSSADAERFLKLCPGRASILRPGGFLEL